MNKNTHIRFSVVDYQCPKVPVFEESQVSPKSFVQYGRDNDYPDILRSYKKQSATLGTIINGITDYIAGDGVDVLPAAAAFAEKMNRRGETVEEIVRQLAGDYALYGGFAIQVIYSRLGIVAEIYALDFAKVRSNKYNDQLFYREDWRTGGKLLKYPSFDRDRAALGREPSQILYFKNGARTTYPQPMYESALKDIRIEIACSDYNLSSISRGFMARYILNMPNDANLTDDQKDTIENGIKEKFCGANLDTNLMIYWMNDGEKLEAQKIEADDTNERFLTTKEDARSNIYTAFRATPNLFGLPSATTGFNSQEYSQSFKLFQKTVIAPMQKAIENAFAKIFGTDEAIRIKPFTINFEDNGNI